MATLSELQEDLELVRAAKRALLTGTPLQRLVIGGVDKTYMSLSQLSAEEDRLARLIASRTSGGARNYAAF